MVIPYTPKKPSLPRASWAPGTFPCLPYSPFSYQIPSGQGLGPCTIS